MMNTYVALVNWTQKGIQEFRESPSRVERAKASIAAGGGEMKSFYLTNFGLGATIFKPAGDLDSKNKFSLSFGGGVKKFFNDRFGIRSQLRAFVTFLGSNDQLYCDRFGCWTYEEVVNFTQFEISTGLIIRL